MRVQISSLAQMRTFAEVLAENLRAGDLLILSGNLGAGKTTFTQSLGRALDVAGRITSPTFVIAREHPSLGEGPALVHVDAYRLSDAEELEDLDLDSELDESITVVEWGEGLAEQLSADYLSLTITPVFEYETGADGEGDADVTDGEGDADSDDEPEPDEHRIVDLHGHGDTWGERWQRLDASIRAIVTVTADEEDTA